MLSIRINWTCSLSMGEEGVGRVAVGWEGGVERV